MFPVKNIMIEDVISVKANTPIYEAIECLETNKIAGLPVVDKNNNLLGILSEWNVLHLLMNDTVKIDSTVNDYMDKHVVTFEENDSAIDICDYFIKSYKVQVPVVKNGKLRGIVNRYDIIKLILMTRKLIFWDNVQQGIPDDKKE